MTAQEIARIVEAYRVRHDSEAELQVAVAEIFRMHGIAASREVRLSRGDRLDFLAGTVGIEIKVDGSLAALTRQLHRYAGLAEVSELLVVTTKSRLARVPREFGGKPIAVALLSSGVM